ncbi:MAG: hypothetical protein M4579_003552 [Chaenotheca gracillima]|nr:MAG: hypothetical protein M4579_003552 [Chaenotheca gracillima]
MSILFQNASRTVFLIDIPTSIASAQGTSECPPSRSLLSSEAPQEPFQILQEPKRPPTRANTVVDVVHDEIKPLIAAALQEIKNCYTSDWHLIRELAGRSNETDASRKRKAPAEEQSLDQDIVPRTSPESRKASDEVVNEQALYTLNDSGGLKSFFINRSDIVVKLSTRGTPDTESRLYYIPPRSAFLDSNIETSIDTFNLATARHLTSSSKSAGPQQFDFILLDPPWPNASAKRSRSYNTPKAVSQTRELILSLDIQDYLAPSGLVGVWVTNKPRFRDLVLGETPNDAPTGQRGSPSLFETWAVEWVEEWIWIKTTATGQPISDLESSWRKPYEILLLGRKRHDGSSHDAGRPEVKRKIIAGVPDLHSRKPSLKELITPYMPDPQDYRALEVFARNLTAGWWAWGNEVLKFNDLRCWREKVDI